MISWRVRANRLIALVHEDSCFYFRLALGQNYVPAEPEEVATRKLSIFMSCERRSKKQKAKVGFMLRRKTDRKSKQKPSALQNQRGSLPKGKNNLMEVKVLSIFLVLSSFFFSLHQFSFFLSLDCSVFKDVNVPFIFENIFF